MTRRPDCPDWCTTSAADHEESLVELEGYLRHEINIPAGDAAFAQITQLATPARDRVEPAEMYVLGADVSIADAEVAVPAIAALLEHLRHGGGPIAEPESEAEHSREGATR